MSVDPADLDEQLFAAIKFANSDHWERKGNYELLVHEIEKGQSDDRQYCAIRLENGMVFVLIHDPTTEKAAVAVDVAVGHLNDPVRSTCNLFFLDFDRGR